MEFHIDTAGAQLDLGAIEEALQDLDPAALLDMEGDGRTLRVSTILEGPTLLGLLAGAGVSVSVEQLYQVPSICCGGCSG